MSADKAYRWLLPLAAFLAVLPLLLRGSSCGHDFDFHLLSWLEAATQYSHGGYPHWAFTPAWNAGEPRFLFYPPLSWTLGALLTLILPIQFAGTAYTFIALTLSGFTAHALARRYATPAVALLCATLYLVNPYMLFTAYERSAFAELLAAAWLPLLFLACLAPRPRIVSLAIPVALLWLTNAPAAVMGCYALAVLTLTRLAAGSATSSLRPQDKRRVAGEARLHLVLTTLAGTALGLLLPAFYLVPAAWERSHVQIAMATISGMRPQDHFLFHRMPGLSPDDLFHNDVVRTASIVAVILLGAIAFLLDRNRAQSRKPAKAGPAQHRNVGPVAVLLLPLTFLIVFLLTPPSLFLWKHTPELAFLQFPWRLCALLAVILLALAGTFPIRRDLPAWLSPVLACALVLPAYLVFQQSCDATDTPTARAALFHSPLGTEPTDEYTPTDADNDVLQRNTPSYAAVCMSPAQPALPPGPVGATPFRIVLNLPCAAQVTLNLRKYPVWHLTDNGHPVSSVDPGPDNGLITFSLFSGQHDLRVQYIRPPDQKLGILISGIALLFLLASITLGKSNFKH